MIKIILFALVLVEGKMLDMRRTYPTIRKCALGAQQLINKYGYSNVRKASCYTYTFKKWTPQ